jgi:hypothetical protein
MSSFINVSEGKISCLSVLDTLMRMPAMAFGDYSTCIVHRGLKVSSWAKCVSAVNAVCRRTDVFNKACILLTDTSQLFKSKYFFPFLIFSCCFQLYFSVLFNSVLASNWLYSCCQAHK